MSSLRVVGDLVHSIQSFWNPTLVMGKAITIENDSILELSLGPLYFLFTIIFYRSL